MRFRVIIDVYFAAGGARIGIPVDFNAAEKSMLPELVEEWVYSTFANKEVENFSYQVDYIDRREGYHFD